MAPDAFLFRNGFAEPNRFPIVAEHTETAVRELCVKLERVCSSGVLDAGATLTLRDVVAEDRGRWTQTPRYTPRYHCLKAYTEGRLVPLRASTQFAWEDQEGVCHLSEDMLMEHEPVQALLRFAGMVHDPVLVTVPDFCFSPYFAMENEMYACKHGLAHGWKGIVADLPTQCVYNEFTDFIDGFLPSSDRSVFLRGCSDTTENSFRNQAWIESSRSDVLGTLGCSPGALKLLEPIEWVLLACELYMWRTDREHTLRRLKHRVLTSVVRQSDCVEDLLAVERDRRRVRKVQRREDHGETRIKSADCAFGGETLGERVQSFWAHRQSLYTLVDPATKSMHLARAMQEPPSLSISPDNLATVDNAAVLRRLLVDLQGEKGHTRSASVTMLRRRLHDQLFCVKMLVDRNGRCATECVDLTTALRDGARAVLKGKENLEGSALLFNEQAWRSREAVSLPVGGNLVCKGKLKLAGVGKIRKRHDVVTADELAKESLRLLQGHHALQAKD